MKKKKKKKNSKKCSCCALIPLNTKKIYAEHMKIYNRRKKTLERLEEQLAVFNENDEPEYQKFLARKFGAEQTRQREIQSEISLYQTRYQKIRFIASERRMSPGRYCYFLSQKIVPEHDFWYLLEEDLEKYRQEEQKREEEERIAREKRRAERESKPESEWTEEDFDDDMDDIWDEMEESGDMDDDDMDFDDFEKNFEKFVNRMLGIPDTPEPAKDTQKELKKLYRELCMKYHPDKSGVHDARMKRIWNEIQSAYETGDLDHLRAIRSDYELTEGKKELNCSDISDLIMNMQNRINALRSELYHQKKNPYSGFSTWNSAQRNKAEKEVREEMSALIRQEEQHLAYWKKQIEKVLHSWKPKPQPPPKPKQKTKAELRKEALDQIDDLFSF